MWPGRSRSGPYPETGMTKPAGLDGAAEAHGGAKEDGRRISRRDAEAQGGRCLRWVFPASPRLCGRFPSGGGARRGRFSRRGAGAQRGDEPLLSWLSNCPSPLRTVSTDSKPFGRACRSIRRETWKRRRGEASGPCPSVKSVKSVVNPPPYSKSAVPRGRGWDGFPAGAQRRGEAGQGLGICCGLGLVQASRRPSR